MKMSMVMCKQIQPLQNIPPSGLNMQLLRPQPQKDRVLVVLGATGTGKSRLSIDLATRFPAEIINSDKIQVYEGLDTITNKVTEEEQFGVPHHLLGFMHPNADFTAADFRTVASRTVKSVRGRGKLPIIVGGSNSYVEALVDDEDYLFRSRFECCFLWVDVAIQVLHSFVSDRVDQMVATGMVDEARSLFDPATNYSRGLRKAIGVPEFDNYFRAEAFSSEETRDKLLRESIEEIKKNTCVLACRQLEKIHRLRNVKGWKLHRVDATDVFRKSGDEAEEAWEGLVAGPSSMIVNRFLYDVGPKVYRNETAAIRAAIAAGMEPAMAVAASH